MSRLSIVIVNWNRLQDLKESIAVLRPQMAPEWELVVVDNGSSDGSVEWLQAQPDLRLVEARENLGPAKGRNLALDVASGDYLLFLDSDAEIRDAGALTALLERMDAEPTIGLIGLKILNHFTGELDQWIYAQSTEEWQGREFETYSFSAAGALVRTKAMQEIEGFWEELFIYCEEVDLSLRLMQAGYTVMYSPKVAVYHRESPEGRVPSGFFFTYQARNWLWIFSRYFPGWRCWWRMMLYSAVYLVKGGLSGQLTAAAKGLWQGWQGARTVRRDRKQIDISVIKRWQELNKRKNLKVGR